MLGGSGFETVIRSPSFGLIVVAQGSGKRDHTKHTNTYFSPLNWYTQARREPKESEKEPVSHTVLRFGCALVLGLVVSGGWPLVANCEDLTVLWRQVFARPDASDLAKQQAPPQMLSLGAELFNDRRLSGDGRRACVSCHRSERSFTDGLARASVAPGITAQLRNTPTLYNLAWAKVFNWDGRAHSIEQQVLGPIENPSEMAGNFTDIIARLRNDADMVAAFANAFPDAPSVSRESITSALAHYVRSLVAPETRFDSWIAGQADALSAQEHDGFKIFVGKGGCVACHSGWRMTNDGFHDIGLPEVDGSTSSVSTAGKIGVRAFKTPTLRRIEHTAPYMHNGSLATLSDVVDHYAEGIVRRKGLSSSLPPNISLSASERSALIAFLRTL